ncbi:MAG: hypothetical protein A2086_10370 [Spirochaetes bacterium GWD1_27_9]|nr:MAG: hypothetical protein A2Z98_03585 [Spirochaetes bacterium GWB1_27_13]OHD22953.1 MAG: hypothetical protein A2Y34_00965 [Spirochaetes bacterium GWC1_27_15]OHD43696.1 MAG: hypothetical protein A2086_10370 [Spirochaetes bacterium GWD1_27_9]
MNNIFYYIKGCIVSPTKTFKELLSEPKLNSYAAIYLIVLEVVYTLLMISYTIAKIKVFYPTFTVIPKEYLHFADIFITAPVTFLGTIMTIALIYLMSKMFKGTGSFDNSLAVLMFAIVTPFFLSFTCDVIMFTLILISEHTTGAFHNFMAVDLNKIMINGAYMVVVLVWNIVLMVKAILVIQKIKLWQSILISIVSAIVFWLSMVVFLF